MSEKTNEVTSTQVDALTNKMTITIFSSDGPRTITWEMPKKEQPEEMEPMTWTESIALKT
jgi:hypothetical protein